MCLEWAKGQGVKMTYDHGAREFANFDETIRWPRGY